MWQNGPFQNGPVFKTDGNGEPNAPLANYGHSVVIKLKGEKRMAL